MGTVMHSCEGEMVCESINPKIPYFNAPIYLENKVCSTQILSANRDALTQFFNRPLSVRSMKSWAPSTRSTSPSSPRKELSRPPSSLVTRSTLVATSSFPWRSMLHAVVDHD